MTASVRVGLLMDSFTQPAWVVAMLTRIQTSDFATINCVILTTRGDTVPQTRSMSERLRRCWSARKHVLYGFYRRWELARFRPTPDACKTSDITGLFEGATTLKVTTHEDGRFDALSEEQLEPIRSEALDVIIRLGGRPVARAIGEAARLGVWSFRCGDPSLVRGGPDGFWEVLLADPVTECALQALNTDPDDVTVIARTWSATHPFSVRLNRNDYLWKISSLLPRKLEEAHRMGIEAFERRCKNVPPLFYSKKISGAPTNRELFPAGVRHFGRYLRRGVRARFYWDQWQLRYRFSDEISTTVCRYEEIRPPGDRFWADPHVVYHDERYHVFIEEYLRDEERARISVMEIRENGSFTDPAPVLEPPYHVSYPYIFRWEGHFYMIPETSEQATVEVYRCESYPTRWSPYATLMRDVSMYDLTLHQHAGKWWMFANMVENPGASSWDELFLFSADHPLSKHWQPHPQNPIVSDVRRARPAGAIFRYRDRWFRPAQDCARAYGYGIRIHEIVTLDEQRYEEREVSVILPDWDKRLNGVHTFGSAGRLSVLDVREKRPILWDRRVDRNRS